MPIPLAAGLALSLGSSALQSQLGGQRAESARGSRNRRRLTRLSDSLLAEADTPLTDREGYGLGMADARAGLREMAEDDAGRAGARGLSGGRAIAAGAQGRAATLARLQRALLTNEDGRTGALQSRAAGLLGNLESLDLADRDRKDRKQAAWMNGLMGAGSTVAQALL